MNKKYEAMLRRADYLQALADRRMVWWCLWFVVYAVTTFATLRWMFNNGMAMEWLGSVVSIGLLSFWPANQYIFKPESKAALIRERVARRFG